MLARLALGLLVAGVAACGLSAEVSRELGARCDGHDECDERCIYTEPALGGFCSLSCDDDDDCPATSACVGVDTWGGVCLFSCEDNPDCEFLGANWYCMTSSGHLPSGEVRVCMGIL